MKVDELSGALLAEWVARANGWRVERDGNEHDDPLICICESGVVYSFGKHGYRPDLNWAQGGPIIERAMITVSPQAYDIGPATVSGWVAVDIVYGVFDDNNGRRTAPRYFAKKCLEAAMRVYVASKFGDTVPDEVA